MYYPSKEYLTELYKELANNPDLCIDYDIETGFPCLITKEEKEAKSAFFNRIRPKVYGSGTIIISGTGGDLNDQNYEDLKNIFCNPISDNISYFSTNLNLEQMTEHLELQLEFQGLAGQTIGNPKSIPSDKDQALRLKLALEELSELADGFGKDKTFCDLLASKIADISEKYQDHIYDSNLYKHKEVLDALIDIEVINNGTIITCGFHGNYRINYRRVDAKNKEKFLKSFEEAQQVCDDLTIAESKETFTIEEINFEGKQRWVVKDSKGKVRKSPNFQPAVLLMD